MRSGPGLGVFVPLESDVRGPSKARPSSLRLVPPAAIPPQVCLCVAAHVAHSLHQNVLYIDSNGGLTASRLLQLLQCRTRDEEEQVRAGPARFL